MESLIMGLLAFIQIWKDFLSFKHKPVFTCYTNTLCMYLSPSQGLTVFPLNGTLQSVVAVHNLNISVGFKSEVLLEP